ncbi:LIM domain-containing protein A, putative isoform 1 [Quillaja saponaria]|uniref:LIM domain-containing protein A, putative isoform 1 n=1 Tax=Quillaja saponaria TaxID=32244 RepID=A0AAD7M4Q3_QUISA|nr:LIM domain-containing protein A, putative isoform 1 [Quillaja saponaria]
MAVDPITDYSQTQRMVLLIDLNPLLHLQDPTPYLTSILTSAKILLSFHSLSLSLFTFKLFFSSLSPLLSSSKLYPLVLNSSLSLSFNGPTFTLQSLSQTLNSLPQFHNPSHLPPPQALHLAASMRELVHDYAWDPVIRDPLTGTLLNCNSVVRSNLVVLFSPVCRSLKCLSEFLNVEINDGSLENVDTFCEKFCGFFQNVSDAFDTRDIHFSWVDVRHELGYGEDKIDVDELALEYRFFESGTRRLGWGFCSTDSIVLGSALVPFALIYPKIGTSLRAFDVSDCSEKLNVQLSLNILDVSKKPLECRCCGLELVSLNFLPRSKCDDVLFTRESINAQTGGYQQKIKLWEQFAHGITKLQVKAVLRSSEFVKFEGHLSDSILLRELSGDTDRVQKEALNEFFADRVLEMLAIEFGNLEKKKSTPTWQIILSFLCKEGYLALVSLSNASGGSYMGILRPFTVSSALLSVIDDVHEVDADLCKPDLDLKTHYKLINTQSGPSTSSKHSKAPGEKTINSNMLQDLTWSTFCKSAYEHSVLNLDEVYLSREINDRKKLKFLKCWMKQIKKSVCSGLALLQRSKLNDDVLKDSSNRLTDSHQECEQPIPSFASVGENSLPEASRIQDEADLDFRSETSEAFFSNLSSKIHQGLEFDVVDLRALAERLVNSSVYWLSQKYDRGGTFEGQTPSIKSNDSYDNKVTVELIKLLLRDPKDLAAKHKSNNSLPASDAGSKFCAENSVREYELQILFRMEILQSEIGVTIGESTKLKFVKQICLLLENIQCHMEGGFFGDWNINCYVSRIIKTRYSHTLGDVVHRICNKMDLLLFADEDESPNQLLNSEDSNISWREKAERDEMGDSNRCNGSVSAEDEPPLQQLENDNGSTQGIKQEDHDHKVIAAKERRQRARRFASFTSWMPDLQRVWAPKQKAIMPMSDPLRKLPNRKDRRRESFDTVCETPMTGNKRSCPRRSNVDDDDHQDNGGQLFGSVSKALFQDDT